jgi:hypothetical protein
VSPGGREGPTVTEPTEDGGSRAISPNVDLGQQIIIAPAQFEPALLIADSSQPVTWTNLTTAVQQITVDSPDSAVSPPIPPGGKWSYTPRFGTNMHYGSTLGLKGAVQFDS